MEILLNNEVMLKGTVVSEIEYSHEIYSETFNKFVLRVPRLSENYDEVIITASERLTDTLNIGVGENIRIEGQFRSYNNYTDTGNKLVLTVFAKSIEQCEDINDEPNSIYLNGYICKEPVYRTTPFGREICDVLIAVNRQYGKSDYIPCITWGRNAKFTGGLEVGTNMKIWGRIQSRNYKKRVTEEEYIEKTAYEVSVTKMEIVHKETAEMQSV
ncbi:MAG: single-stranded DNA-binding protein [Clostridia bacterium]|nr:single-stranded DNA-binding protein [Clostridia bacterium]